MMKNFVINLSNNLEFFTSIFNEYSSVHISINSQEFLALVPRISIYILPTVFVFKALHISNATSPSSSFLRFDTRISLLRIFINTEHHNFNAMRDKNMFPFAVQYYTFAEGICISCTS